MQSEECWYTRRENTRRGPFSSADVRRYVLLGRILPGDHMSRDGEHWSPLRELPELLPNEMRNVQTAADRERLRQAQADADERRGRDRRDTIDGTRRFDDALVERRSARGRRRTDRRRRLTLCLCSATGNCWFAAAMAAMGLVALWYVA